MPAEREIVLLSCNPQILWKDTTCFVLETDEENFTSVCKNPAVIETDYNQYFKNKGQSRYILM